MGNNTPQRFGSMWTRARINQDPLNLREPDPKPPRSRTPQICGNLLDPPAFRHPPPKATRTKTMTTTICELSASANGSSRAVLQRNGGDLEWKATQKTSMVWQPNSYDVNSNTLDFCFSPTAEVTDFVSKLEAEIGAQVTKDSEKFFGIPLAPEIVKSKFQKHSKLATRDATTSSAKAATRTSSCGTEIRSR